MTSSLLQAFGSLVLVILLAFVVLFFVKKFVYKDFTGFSNKTNLSFKIISQVSLLPKKSIFLVKVFDRILVVGVTDVSMNILSEINDKGTIEDIESSFSEKNADNTKFLNILKSNIGLKT
jgi:flagellar biosynthetic protein FliO